MQGLPLERDAEFQFLCPIKDGRTYEQETSTMQCVFRQFQIQSKDPKPLGSRRRGSRRASRSRLRLGGGGWWVVGGGGGGGGGGGSD